VLWPNRLQLIRCSPKTGSGNSHCAVRSTAELRTRLLLPADVGSNHTADFPVLVPESFLRRMQPGNPLDPLLLQVLPQSAELESPPGFVSDPVGDMAARRSPGLLHKYHGRALLITTSACAVHCRYCFRREYPYADEPAAALMTGIRHCNQSPRTAPFARSSSVVVTR
jgi:L-lysine 2,3-aminomutase